MLPPLFVILTGGAAAVSAFGAWAAHRDRKEAAARAEELSDRLARHPARGLPAGQITAGDHLPITAGPIRLDPVIRAVITSAPSRRTSRRGKRPRIPLPPSLDSRPACHGDLWEHRDGTTFCTNGHPDCWGADGKYSHGRRRDCSQMSHGCGTCQTTGPRP